MDFESLIEEFIELEDEFGVKKKHSNPLHPNHAANVAAGHPAAPAPPPAVPTPAPPTAPVATT